MAQFKTSARAVDMLGRQQIAGVPTAISELFKNAHDAYATKVTADLIREQRILVIRDNGRGMSRGDFENRWLVLGTDSKLGPQKAPAGFKRREMLGEKGIGRLAIALLGPQVLVMTRPKLGKSGGDLTVALIDWRLFEIPGIALDQVQVPIEVLKPGALPGEAVIQKLRRALLNNAEELHRATDGTAGFQSDVASPWDDVKALDELLKAPSLGGDGYGTHFIISPVGEDVLASVGSGDGGGASELTRFLLGFTNSMVPGHSPPVLEVAFNDHRSGDDVRSLVDEGEFFVPDDFLSSDHQIRGEFDRNGGFHGSVTVFGEGPEPYDLPPPGSVRSPSRCGPFRFDLAVVQPEAKSSSMSAEAHTKLRRKTQQIGGLYVYREGVRVLPYGNVDYDYLEIEERRTRSAGYYYFSHRNIFGAVSITRSDNSGLVDKAGREGFQRNGAYRDFVDLLENLFLQLAADFFRKGGSRADPFTHERTRLQELHRAKQEYETRAKAERQRLTTLLAAGFEYVQNDLESELHGVREVVEHQIGEAASPDELVIAEADVQRMFRAIRSKVAIREPEGAGLDANLRDLLSEFTELARSTEDSQIAPLERWATEKFQQAAERLAEQDVHAWAISWADETIQEAREHLSPVLDGVEVELRRLLEEVVVTRASIDDAFGKLREKFEVNVAAAAGKRSESLGSERAAVLEGLAEWERVDEMFSSNQALLQLVSVDLDRDGVTPLTAMRALDEEAIAYRERAQLDVEMIQLGMAVDILSHEFDDSIRSVRNDLRRLSAWANENPDLAPLYRDLVSSFEHLDGYLRLLTPLARRLYRSRDTVTGKDIHRYLTDLFGERLEREEVELEMTKGFERWSVESFRSTFYPVFVNLIDNALFWLRDRSQPRRIRLSTRGRTVMVCDTGPGVAERDVDRIFERGFTRKPGGRGLGLYISKQVLADEGFTVRVNTDGALGGACFEISEEE
ncbi:MAG TPA: ATP-binding protein [Acidimicrobiia bacterium]|nr:ATP-binding protein [Acidimicrobiia bacterium]